MKKIIKFAYFNLFISIVLIFILNMNSIYTLDLKITLLTFIIILLTLFIIDNIISDKKINKFNMKLYYVIYILLIICLTLLTNRSGFGLITKEYFKDYIKLVNFIPFKTIFEYIKMKKNFDFFYNISCNLLIFAPIILLNFINNNKYTYLKNHIKLTFLLSFTIEILQFIFSAGRFDIDDLILNVGGGIILFYLFKNTKIIKIIKNIISKFNKIKEKYKFIMLILLLTILIIFNILIIIETK